MSELKPVSKQRPYFIWDYDLSEEDVRAILRGDNEYEKVQMMVRIMESAHWEDIWNYLTLAQIQEHWPEIQRRMRKEIRDAWSWAFEVWEHGTA
jgi:c-di-GMP-related signal transduction protein